MFVKVANHLVEATVFICGALLMVLEIMGARLLTPFYGDTVFVWGSVIGVFLLSLSLGYFFGGKLADKQPKRRLLGWILVATSFSIFLVPYIYQQVVDLSNLLPRMYSPLLAVTLLFLVPSLLLGMVSPFAIRLKAKTVKKIGMTSGNLYAISTIGSVVGTFLATFVLTLVLPTKIVFICTAAISFLLAAVLIGKKLSAAMVISAALLFVIAANSHSGTSQTMQSGNTSLAPLTQPVNIESLYGQITVEDSRAYTRALLINGGLMMEMDLRNQSNILPGWEYVKCMEIPFAMNPAIKSSLNMGLGAGLYPRYINGKYGTDVETVDINDKILEVAMNYFNFTPSDSLRVYIDDARVYLQNTNKKYDLITIDVFHYDPGKGYKLSFHLATQEFFTLVFNHLNAGGIMAMNLVSAQNSSFLSSEYKTASSVFDSVYMFNCGTHVMIASKDKRYDISALAGEKPEFKRLLRKYYAMVPKGESIILTDDFAPINPFEELG